jgi:hypothetical protein
MALKCCTAVWCCHSRRKLHHQAQAQQQASPCLCPTPWHLAAKSNVSCTCRGRAPLHILHVSPSAGAASRRVVDKLPYATQMCPCSAYTDQHLQAPPSALRCAGQFAPHTRLCAAGRTRPACGHCTSLRQSPAPVDIALAHHRAAVSRAKFGVKASSIDETVMK